MLTEFAYVALLLGALFGTGSTDWKVYCKSIRLRARTLLSPLLAAHRTGLYRIADVDENREMSWKTYVSALLVFNVLGIAAVFLLQELQGWLPFNPQGLGAGPLGHGSEHRRLLHHQH